MSEIQPSERAVLAAEPEPGVESQIVRVVRRVLVTCEGVREAAGKVVVERVVPLGFPFVVSGWPKTRRLPWRNDRRGNP